MTDKEEQSATSMRGKALSVWADTFLAKLSHISGDIMAMNEQELEKHFKPTPTDFALRKKFWAMSNHYLKLGTPGATITELLDGICSYQNFYANTIRSDHRLIWITMPIQKHMEIIEEGLYFALKRVRDEVLTMPLTEKNLAAYYKYLEFFANRSESLGPLLQRIEQKSMNVNVDASRLVESSINPEELMQRYADMKEKIVSLPAAPVSVDGED